MNDDQRPSGDNWFITWPSGSVVSVDDPERSDVWPEDIAHALSQQCRFAGHCRTHYSVAQHSVAVAEACKVLGFNKKVQWWGLMHDAAEAYLQDIIRPLKLRIGPHYRMLERRWEDRLSRVFRLPPPGSVEWKPVKQVDNWMLKMERRDLTAFPRKWLDMTGVPSQLVESCLCRGLAAPKAYEQFLLAYEALRPKQHTPGIELHPKNKE